MPKLPRLVHFLLIQSIFKLGVAKSQLLVEFRFVLDLGKVEWLARREDDGLLREVAIVGIV